MADRYEAMFLAAVQSLAEISKALDIPDDEASVANGNELILEAIADLQRGMPQPVGEVTGEGRRYDAFVEPLVQWSVANLEIGTKLYAHGVTPSPAPQREVPPGKWKVDMPDGTYGRMPGDPPGPASVCAVIGGYVYDVEPRNGMLIASAPPTGYRLQKFNEEMQQRAASVRACPEGQQGGSNG